MELRFQGLGITSTIYTCPSFATQGVISAWKGKDAGWRGGFVVRVLWFGFVLRWARVPYLERQAKRAVERYVQRVLDAEYMNFFRDFPADEADLF